MNNKSLKYNDSFNYIPKAPLKATTIKSLFYLIASASIIILACLFSCETSYGRPIKYTVVILLFMILTPMIQRALLLPYLQLERAWVYRLALLASVSLGIILWLFHFFIVSGDFPSWLLTSILLGGFLGALAITCLDCGLFEINGSPSQSLKEAVRQNHLELLDELPKEPWIKRIFDLLLSGIAVIFLLPVWVIIILLIWWEDPGPILFIKNSVGRNGINFRQFKFRTMVRDAEKHTGLVLASKNDKRILKIGRFLRTAALDESPQLINILRGDMSFVGPRPQRTILVNNYLKAMPRYALRHAVRPGLAGLAQVMGHYHITPLQKLRFDSLYVLNIGLWLDLKLVLSAVLIVYWLRFKNSWDIGGDYSKALRDYHRKMLKLFKIKPLR